MLGSAEVSQKEKVWVSLILWLLSYHKPSALLVLIILINLFCWPRKISESKNNIVEIVWHSDIKNIVGSDDTKLLKLLNSSSLSFKYSTIEKATGSFDCANKLGQGGFGAVYKVVSQNQPITLIHVFLHDFEFLVYDMLDQSNDLNLIRRHYMINFVTGCSSRWKRDRCQKTFFQPPT